MVDPKIKKQAVPAVPPAGSAAFMSSEEAGEILSKELLNLSVQDRNEVTEEIHGVASMNTPETPELLETSLSKMMNELAKIPSHKKVNYTKALSYTDSYVHTDRFKLRFLRAVFFDAKEAANRLTKFLDILGEAFGGQVLRRPVCLDDFTKKEQLIIKKGPLQMLPYRDSAGRRIVICFPTDDISGDTPYTRVKISLYYSFIAMTNGLEEDLETQRKGIVMILWFDPKFGFGGGMKERPASRLRQTTSIRVAALHICTPKTVQSRFSRFFFEAAPVRARIRIHLGSPMELFYTLNSFGIPAEILPITTGGKIKTTSINQWFKTRRVLERNERDCEYIVECPNSTDIVFKRGGKNAVHNAGNTRFRSIIQKKWERGGFMEMTQTKLADELQKEFTLGGFRIIRWKENQSRFIRATDEKTIYSKIEYSIRAFREKDSQSINRRVADTLLEKTTSGATTRTLDFDVAGGSRKRFKFINGSVNGDGNDVCCFQEITDSDDSSRADFCAYVNGCFGVL